MMNLSAGMQALHPTCSGKRKLHKKIKALHPWCGAFHLCCLQKYCAVSKRLNFYKYSGKINLVQILFNRKVIIMPDTQLTCDVLIVGGGPAGLSVAAALPKDVSVIIVHQDRDIGKPVRTSGGSFLADVTRLGIPKEYYQTIDTLDFYSDNEFARFPLATHKMVVLDITGLYQWLARKSEHKNRQLFLASKFITTAKKADHYVSQIRSREAKDLSITSKYVIDASGHPCAVLESLSLGNKPDRVGVGIEYEYDIGDNDPNRAILFVGRDALSGYGWVFPTPDNRLRVGVGVIHPDTEASPRDLYKQFLASPALEKFDIKISDKPLETNAGIIPSIAYDPKLVFGNIIRVGDSANFATPTVGEGIRICIEMGELLGRQLGKAIKSNSTKPLAEYEKKCRKAFSKNYLIGFLSNKKMSTYAPNDWDSSIRRIRRLNENQVTALIRSEFSASMALSALWKLIKHKITPRK